MSRPRPPSPAQRIPALSRRDHPAGERSNLPRRHGSDGRGLPPARQAPAMPARRFGRRRSARPHRPRTRDRPSCCHDHPVIRRSPAMSDRRHEAAEEVTSDTVVPVTTEARVGTIRCCRHRHRHGKPGRSAGHRRPARIAEVPHAKATEAPAATSSSSRNRPHGRRRHEARRSHASPRLQNARSADVFDVRSHAARKEVRTPTGSWPMRRPVSSRPTAAFAAAQTAAARAGPRDLRRGKATHNQAIGEAPPDPVLRWWIRSVRGYGKTSRRDWPKDAWAPAVLSSSGGATATLSRLASGRRRRQHGRPIPLVLAASPRSRRCAGS